MLTEAYLVDALRRRYPKWPLRTCEAIAETAIPLYVEQSEVVGEGTFSVPALLAHFTSNDGVLTCGRCSLQLGACACRCTPRCTVEGCGFISLASDPCPVAEVVTAISNSAKTLPDVSQSVKPLEIEGNTLIDGHHRLASLVQSPGDGSVAVIVIRGEAARQLAWNRLCVLQRPRCVQPVRSSEPSLPSPSLGRECDRCGRPQSSTPGWCPACGEQRPDGTVCPRCWTTVREYCPSCGERSLAVE